MEAGLTGIVDADFQRRAVASAFQRGRTLENLGDFDAAFSAYCEAQSLARSLLSVSPETTDASNAGNAAKIQRVFTRDFIRRLQEDFEQSPIFIIGLPRSGSTLVEQILASHPDVEPLGETMAMPQIAAHLRLVPPFPAGMVSEMRSAYLSLVGVSGGSRFSDKLLLNRLCLGVIEILFPRAIILHMRRSALDQCLSCFTTSFWEPPSWVVDLRLLAREYIRYTQLMAHWRSTLPGRVIDVSYEALVADPVGQTRLLLETCKLSWHEGCLRFYENGREANTASREQVKEPINDASIGRWRKFERHLKPLVDGLGPFAST